MQKAEALSIKISNKRSESSKFDRKLLNNPKGTLEFELEHRFSDDSRTSLQPMINRSNNELFLLEEDRNFDNEHSVNFCENADTSSR